LIYLIQELHPKSNEASFDSQREQNWKILIQKNKQCTTDKSY